MPAASWVLAPVSLHTAMSTSECWAGEKCLHVNSSGNLDWPGKWYLWKDGVIHVEFLCRSPFAGGPDRRLKAVEVQPLLACAFLGALSVADVAGYWSMLGAAACTQPSGPAHLCSGADPGPARPFPGPSQRQTPLSFPTPHFCVHTGPSLHPLHSDSFCFPNLPQQRKDPYTSLPFCFSLSTWKVAPVDLGKRLKSVEFMTWAVSLGRVRLPFLLSPEVP